MKIPKEIPYEQLSDEEKRIKDSGGIVTQETRKKAKTILDALDYYNKQNNENLDLDVINALKDIENKFRKLASKE